MIKAMFIKLFKKEKAVSAPSFFDYPASEKKKIMKKAAQESNKMQLDLVKRYAKAYSSQ